MNCFVCDSERWPTKIITDTAVGKGRLLCESYYKLYNHRAASWSRILIHALYPIGLLTSQPSSERVFPPEFSASISNCDTAAVMNGEAPLLPTTADADEIMMM